MALEAPAWKLLSKIQEQWHLRPANFLRRTSLPAQERSVAVKCQLTQECQLLFSQDPALAFTTGKFQAHVIVSKHFCHAWSRWRAQSVQACNYGGKSGHKAMFAQVLWCHPLGWATRWWVLAQINQEAFLLSWKTKVSQVFSVPARRLYGEAGLSCHEKSSRQEAILVGRSVS